MNEYTMDTLQVGTEEAFTVTVTAEMQDEFMRITGDVNPMHTDAQYAALHGYGGGVLYTECLQPLFFQRLQAFTYPAGVAFFRNAVCSLRVLFTFGDELTVSGRVTQIDARFSRVAIKAQITNQRAEKVLRGKLLVGILED